MHWPRTRALIVIMGILIFGSSARATTVARSCPHLLLERGNQWQALQAEVHHTAATGALMRFRIEDSQGLNPAIAAERNNQLFALLDQTAEDHPNMDDLPQISDAVTIFKALQDHPISRWIDPAVAGPFFRAKCNQRALCHYLEWVAHRGASHQYVYNIWMRGSLDHDLPNHPPFRFHVAGLSLMGDRSNPDHVPQWKVIDPRTPPGVLSPREWNDYAESDDWDLAGDRRLYISPGRQFTPRSGGLRSIVAENAQFRDAAMRAGASDLDTLNARWQHEESDWRKVFDYYRTLGIHP